MDEIKGLRILATFERHYWREVSTIKNRPNYRKDDTPLILELPLKPLWIGSDDELMDGQRRLLVARKMHQKYIKVEQGYEIDLTKDAKELIAKLFKSSTL